MAHQDDFERASVRHEIALHCVDQHDRPLAFMATFDYSAATPYAVRLTCHLPETDPTWTAERSLLEAGLTRSVGFGMVRVAPATSETGRPMVVIALLSSEGALKTQADAEAVKRFLAETQRVVPAGQESAYVDLDELVQELLSS